MSKEAGKGDKQRELDKRYCTDKKLHNEFNRIFKKKEGKKK